MSRDRRKISQTKISRAVQAVLVFNLTPETSDISMLRWKAVNHRGSVSVKVHGRLGIAHSKLKAIESSGCGRTFAGLFIGFLKMTLQPKRASGLSLSNGSRWTCELIEECLSIIGT